MLARLPFSLAHPPAMVRLRPLHNLLHVAAFALLFTLVLTPSHGADQKHFRQAAAPYALDIVGWHIREFAGRSDRIVPSLLAQIRPLDDADQQLVRRYFSDERIDVVQASRPGLEAALERALGQVLRQQHVPPLFTAQPSGTVFPPVSLALADPPKLLVVSPRSHITVDRTLLLKPGLSMEQTVAVEDRVDSRTHVSLVTPIGGLATYPSLIAESSPPYAVLETAAHEWVHAYLFFTPLGLAYWTDYEARMINETAATIAGRELGHLMADMLALEAPPQTVTPSRTEFSAEMRATRIEVERLLSLGKIEDAEAYMAQRTEFFQKLGYPVRKLNQAYFAFYGSYAEHGAAGENLIVEYVKELRARSDSVGHFLQLVGQARTAQDLARMLGH